jgi:anti-sigma factor RsiW
MAVAALARPTTAVHIAGETLSAFVDGELEADEQRRVVAHLHECAACLEVVSAYRTQGILLRRLPVQPVPQALGRALMDRLPAA